MRFRKETITLKSFTTLVGGADSCRADFFAGGFFSKRKSLLRMVVIMQCDRQLNEPVKGPGKECGETFEGEA